ncbi:MAG: DegV family EDD domain-containing protein [Lachnospiraceae bacterium]|nr:DegV family EDD domain-containing protein [Lachnospiraceae bacterium]
MGTAILTDTNSGISVNEARAMGIFSMPMPVIIEGKNYYENESLTVDEYMKELLAKKDVTTSMPSPGDLIDMWESIFDEGYDELVYIPMSSGLSSSCSSAYSCMDDYEGRVFVVDNHRISVTLRGSVMDAKRLSDSGRSGAEIKDILEAMRNDSVVYLGVDTLEYFMKTGRATSAAASLVSNVLSVKPILRTTGEKFEPVTAVRGAKKCAAKIIENMHKEMKTRFSDVSAEDMLIGVAGSFTERSEAEKWFSTVKEAFPDTEVFYDPLSCSITTHTGPNAMGVGMMKKCHI